MFHVWPLTVNRWGRHVRAGLEFRVFHRLPDAKALINLEMGKSTKEPKKLVCLGRRRYS